MPIRVRRLIWARASSFFEKLPGTAPYLSRIHNFTYGATLSMGLSASSISGMKYGLPRLIQAVVGDLFREDADHHFQNLLAYADKDITTLELPEDRSRVPDVEVPGSDPDPRRSHPSRRVA